MKRNLIVTLTVAILFVCLAVSMPSGAAEKPIKWKMTSLWTPVIQLIEGDRHFVDLVNKLSNGALKVKFFDGGTLVPPYQVFEAVAKGTIDAGSDSAFIWAGKDTAFGLLGAYPFGLTAVDYMVWIYQGGGFDLYQEVYGKFGMVYLPYGVTGMESGIRGHKPINGLSDLKGLKVRMSGKPQGHILKEIGASQTVMSGGEIYQALEKGVIDAGEYCTPSIDWGMGFQEVTEYWATPGWHQPSTLLGVMINKKSWDKLPAHLQEVVKTAAMANMMWSFSFFESQAVVGTENFMKKGVKITRLGDEDLAKLQSLANEYTIAEAKKNPLFAKVAYSQMKFMKEISQWRKISHPFSYGRNPVLPDLDAIKKYVK